MDAKVNCIFTKGLIPFVEREVGPEGAVAILRAVGRSREYLMADHNWISLSVADALVRLAMELMREPDEERWARRYADAFMDWKPSREERSYLGTYTMGIGNPRALYQRCTAIYPKQQNTFLALDIPAIGRSRARFRWTPLHGVRLPRWYCVWTQVQFERFPTNWGLPRAAITEGPCVARGDDVCLWDLRWRNPSLGARFWGSSAAGAAGAAFLWLALGAAAPVAWPVQVGLALLPAAAGVALGYGLREGERRRHTQRLLDLQAEEVIYSNNELAKKFRDLETKIEQLSLLGDLSAAVGATLDPEKVYDQALGRLVYGMGYERAQLLRVDAARGVLRGHRMAGAAPDAALAFERLEVPLDIRLSTSARAVATGLPIVVSDVRAPAEPVHTPTVDAQGIRSFVSVPLRVKGRVFGVLNVVSKEPDRFAESDVELISAVTNHVSLAVDRAESFQTIEDLTRGLEEKVRVRTEQLRAANEELQAAYRDLQATQMQLIQREKMASVGQLVAGVAHELNNPIGFVYSNVATLEDFVGRLRAMLESYGAIPLPEDARARVDAHRETLKVDYALKYLDTMIQGIREGAERARKIVRDLRVFARTQDDVWQAVDLHEELESSLTLLNHLLKDRITVERRFGELPTVECVRSQIDQVFLNLLANAAQAITGEGTITIETRAEGDRVAVTIGDTGPGIPPEALGRIFDPFFTTKPVGEGTGLGLSISYELVKKHRGEILVESPSTGQGATFTVRLPVERAG